jgi:hypothetical protein
MKQQWLALCSASSGLSGLSGVAGGGGTSPAATPAINLFTANQTGNGVSVLLGNGDGTFQTQTTYAAGANVPTYVRYIDVNADGFPDLVVAEKTGKKVSVLLGNGNGTFQAALLNTAGNSPRAVAVGDLNGDGKMDLVVANGNVDNNIGVLLGNGNGTFAAMVTYATDTEPNGVALADVNGDGILDIVTANYAGRTASVLLGNGNGTFQAAVNYVVGVTTAGHIEDCFDVAVADLNADGKQDIVISNFRSSTMGVLLGNGDGTFQGVQTYAVAGSTVNSLKRFALADLNGDGKLDVAVACNPEGYVSVLLGNGDGSFQAEQTYATGALPQAVVAADFNGDGKLDLAIPSSGTNLVSVLLGNGNGSFQTKNTFAAGGAPVNITAGLSQIAALTPTKFSLTTPASPTAGANTTFTVTVQDPYGATATGYTGTIYFGSTDTGATLPAATTFAGGIGTFSATLKTAGSQKIRAMDRANNLISGNVSTTVSTAAFSKYSVVAPSTATAGVQITFTVTAQDQFSNTVTSYTGTTHITCSDANNSTVLPANNTLTAGVGTFSATLTTSGTATITANDVTTSSLTGSSAPINVAASATAYSYVVSPTGASNATSGTPISVAVTAFDKYGNISTGYPGTVNFTSTDVQAVLPANSTLANGTGSFSATLAIAATQTITAADSVTSTINGHTGTITVAVGSLTHFLFNSAASATVGTALVITVTARDFGNNTVTAYAGSVHFTSSDASTDTTLPANSTITAGVGTFSATLTNQGNQTITVADSATSSLSGVSGSINVALGASPSLLIDIAGLLNGKSACTDANATSTTTTVSANVLSFKDLSGNTHHYSTTGASGCTLANAGNSILAAPFTGAHTFSLNTGGAGIGGTGSNMRLVFTVASIDSGANYHNLINDGFMGFLYRAAGTNQVGVASVQNVGAENSFTFVNDNKVHAFALLVGPPSSSVRCAAWMDGVKQYDATSVNGAGSAIDNFIAGVAVSGQYTGKLQFLEMFIGAAAPLTDLQIRSELRRMAAAYPVG